MFNIKPKLINMIHKCLSEMPVGAKMNVRGDIYIWRRTWSAEDGWYKHGTNKRLTVIYYDQNSSILDLLKTGLRLKNLGGAHV